jgi:hypothetical protein
MKWLACAIMNLLLGFQGIYSQANDIPYSAEPVDTLNVPARIRGELSLTETLGGRISGTSFNGDEAFTATSLSADLYLTGELSFGPEAGIFVAGTIRPLLGCNVAYTFWHAGGKRGAYLRLGYGIIPPVEDHTTADTWSLFTAGLGIKFILSPKSLFRLELNYKQQWWKNHLPIYELTSPPSGSEVYQSDYELYQTKSSAGILIGVSFVLQ